MRILKTTSLSEAQHAQIDRLWNSEYPVNLAGRYGLLLDGIAQFQHHLLLDDAGTIAGWAVEFFKDDEMRFSIIVDSGRQGRGYGALLLDSLKSGLDEFYGWVIDHDRDLRADGAAYRTPLPFYLKNGFELLSDQRIESPIISAVKIKWSRKQATPPAQYLDYSFQDTPATVSTFDELPLWSAPFGLLLLKHLELRSGMTVLDIGCGAGFPLLELAERLGTRSRVYGVDPWTNALDRVREKIHNYGIRNVSLIEGAGANLPFGDNSADLVVSNLGINNFENPAATLRECFRVLKPGGRLALTTNLDGHWQGFYDLFEQTLSELGESAAVEALQQQQRHRGTVASVAALLEAAGFTMTRHVEDAFDMNFADGSAFLNHHFVKLGWLESWTGLVTKATLLAVFTELERRLNELAAAQGGLRLGVPIAFIEGAK